MDKVTISGNRNQRKVIGTRPDLTWRAKVNHTCTCQGSLALQVVDAGPAQILSDMETQTDKRGKRPHLVVVDKGTVRLE